MTNPATSPQTVLASRGKEGVLAGFTDHYDDVARYASGKTSGSVDAHDVVQDAYLRVMRLPHPENILAPKHFLFRLVRNLIIDRVRKQQVRDRHLVTFDHAEPVADLSPAPDRAVVTQEQRALLEAALATLPERSREIFILNAYGHMSYAEIAEHMAISKSAVAKHLAKSMRRIHESLAAHEARKP